MPSSKVNASPILLGILCLAWTPAPSQGSAAQKVKLPLAGSGERAAKLLEVARGASRRTASPAALRSLSFGLRRTWDNKPDKAVESTYTLLLPDRFKVEFGTITHVIDGSSSHQSKELPEAVRRIAEENGRVDFLRWKLLFLLSLPEDVTLEHIGEVTGEAGTEHRVAVRTANGEVATLGLDLKSHLPTRLLFTAPCGTTDLSVAERREVGGVLLPTRLRFSCSEFRAHDELVNIRVNDPRISPREFARP